MEIILYIYFAINLLIAVYFLESSLKWYGIKHTVVFFFSCLLFGAVVSVFLLLFKIFTPILGWIYREIRFQYRFYFTKYWDKIFLDDNYSEEFRTKEEKLERMMKIMSGFSKQTVRHSKQIQNKYGRV